MSKTTLETSDEEMTALTEIEETKINSKAKTITDNLARLLETDSTGCTAACLINNKILISDNEFKTSEEVESTRRFQQIEKVLEYFQAYEGDKSTDEHKNIFKEICQNKIKGEERGYLKLLTEEDINMLTNIFLESPKDQQDAEFSKWKKTLPREKRKFAATAFEICATIQHDLTRVEHFIQNNPEHSFTQALREYAKPVQVCADDTISYSNYKITNNNESGILLVYTNNESVNSKPQHAELQIIDYLIFTGNFPIPDEKKENIYIGISKLCCLECATAIESCNEYAQQQNQRINTTVGEEDITDNYIKKIETRGEHDINFEQTPSHFLKPKNVQTPQGYYTDKFNKKHTIPLNENLETFSGSNPHMTFIYQNQKIVNGISKIYISVKEKRNSEPQQIKHEEKKSKTKKPAKSMYEISSSSEEDTTEPLQNQSYTDQELLKGLFERYYNDKEAIEALKKFREIVTARNASITQNLPSGAKRKSEDNLSSSSYISSYKGKESASSEQAKTPSLINQKKQRTDQSSSLPKENESTSKQAKTPSSSKNNDQPLKLVIKKTPELLEAINRAKSSVILDTPTTQSVASDKIQMNSTKVLKTWVNTVAVTPSEAKTFTKTLKLKSSVPKNPNRDRS